MSNTPAWLTRQQALIGETGCAHLRTKTVWVVGLGGVGGHAAEALARTGIGRLVLIDADVVDESNRNRQLFATADTVGMAKTDAAVARLCTLSPDTVYTALQMRVTPENVRELLTAYPPDAVLDAIDDVPAKVALAVACAEANIPMFSAMGTGNKLHPERLMLSDISKTAYCPLAKAVRTALRRVGITHLSVVWSDEPPVKVTTRTPASVSFVPAAAGLLLASAVVNRFLEVDAS